MPDDVRAVAAALDVPVSGLEPVGLVEAPYRFDRRHVRRVYYVLFPEGAGGCR
jgi:hypothetical protein